jgi:hypothetical protein
VGATKKSLQQPGFWRRVLQAFAGLMGGLLATGHARAVDLPENRADAMIHAYDGGGVTATGPALLVRKSLADKVSLSASYYVDMVSNASIDVVTTASPYSERRSEHGFGLDYAVRDTLLSLSTASSSEPDYEATSISGDIAQEVFGGMTTVSLGLTRGSDKVGKHGSPEFADTALHWRHRLGLTQILTPNWLASANFEAVSDDGFLGSPYRAARVFGAAIPERDPRTRTSRAADFRIAGDLGELGSVHADYRYFWDTWDIRARTLELGYSRYFSDSGLNNRWLVDTYLRYYTQTHALFYSDNATVETLYVSRNRQLSTFNDIGIGVRASYVVKREPGKYEIKLNGAYERMRYRFSDFTDLRTGSPYSYDANVLQVFVSATF